MEEAIIERTRGGELRRRRGGTEEAAGKGRSAPPPQNAASRGQSVCGRRAHKVSNEKPSQIHSAELNGPANVEVPPTKPRKILADAAACLD